LFEKYRPDLVVASTPGWRLDRYLLREAVQRGVITAAAIVGWDNPSSYRLPGAPIDHITCWSEIQKQELVLGSDWDPAKVNIGGIPSYDGYFRKEWLMTRDEYFRLHGLDPQRKLLAYASSFVTFAPNYRNIETLARLVASDALAEPSQLLIRLHPNHFMPGSLYEGEAARVRELVKTLPHVHLVEPVPLGGELGYYSGEDMPEKCSMMAYADVFLTVYSTMVVETALHERPIVALCLDTPGGWNTPGKFSLDLSEIGEWPTHLRFRAAGAGRVAMDEKALREAVDLYLRDPQADAEARRKFIHDEVTFTDGSAGRRTGDYLLSLLQSA
jgi:CDP-glycerol glycerophosphotransferase (TagB/SpsB family)